MQASVSKVLTTKDGQGGIVYSTNFLPEPGFSGSPILLMNNDRYNWYNTSNIKFNNVNNKVITKKLIF